MMPFMCSYRNKIRIHSHHHRAPILRRHKTTRSAQPGRGSARQRAGSARGDIQVWRVSVRAPAATDRVDEGRKEGRKKWKKGGRERERGREGERERERREGVGIKKPDQTKQNINAVKAKPILVRNQAPCLCCVHVRLCYRMQSWPPSAGCLCMRLCFSLSFSSLFLCLSLSVALSQLFLWLLREHARPSPRRLVPDKIDVPGQDHVDLQTSIPVTPLKP